jgi:hypothetical protein
MVANSETAIFRRIIQPDTGDLPAEAARYLLRLDFTPADHDRMANLSTRASEGALSPDEQQELDGYLQVSDLIAFMQSKARHSLSHRDPHR